MTPASTFRITLLLYEKHSSKPSKMHISSLALPVMALLSVTNACYFTVHSSTVGDFKAQHSEPKDHGGAAQTITGSKGSCYFSGNLLDGCTIQVKVNNGCGTLTFTRIGTD